MRKAFPWLCLAAALAFADQLTKLAVLSALRPGELREITGFFNLVLVFNKGAAFSFLAGASGWQTPLFVAITLAAVVIVTVLLFRFPERQLFCIGLAFILGGALGNVVDRLRFGHVVDFLDLHALGWHWPAFNLADSAISIGAGLLILESFVHKGK